MRYRPRHGNRYRRRAANRLDSSPGALRLDVDKSPHLRRGILFVELPVRVLDTGDGARRISFGPRWSVDKALCGRTGELVQLCLDQFCGRRTRSLRSVVTTKHPCQASTSSTSKTLETCSNSARRPGLVSLTNKTPWCVPGAKIRVSEKSKSCVTSKRPDFCAACQTASSGSPARSSSRTVSTS